MTLKYMQGFETMRDDSDFRAQGWAPNPSKATTKNVALIPSVTTLSGISLRPFGSLQAPTTAAGGWGTSTANDFGYFNTGVTVNQAWNAGGITLGFNARFNSGVTASYGAGSTANASASCFDGTRYWAIQAIGSSYNLYFSTNLQTWTISPAQPVAMSNLSSVYAFGGVVYVSPQGSSGTATVYASNNNGASWTTIPLVGGTAGNPQYYWVGPTGNATYPHMSVISGYATGGIAVGTLGGTMTNVGITFPNAVNNAATCRIRTFGPYVVTLISTANNGLNTYIYSALSASASLNTSAAWSTSTSTATLGVAYDVCYNPVSNNWVVASSNGLWTTAGAGAAGSSQPPAASATWAQHYSTVGMTGVYWNGSLMVAVGQQGHIVTSPDGVTWTESGGHIMSPAVSSENWLGSLYDGTQYVLFSDPVFTGCIVTTPDLVTNYVCQYAMESAEVSTAISSSLLGCALVPGTTAPSATTGQWSTVTNMSPVMLQFGPLSSTTRPWTLDFYSTGSSGVTGTLSLATTLDHYFELHYVKSTAATNEFTCTLYIDGSLAGTTTAVSVVGTTDTTSLFIICFQRNGVFTAFDDIYVTLDDAVAGTAQGPLGIINIMARRPSTDVSDAWVKNGAAASNSLSTRQNALSSLSTNFVSSANSGDKDVYASSDTIPAGFTPKAVALEGYFARTSTSTPSVNVGLSAGGTEVDGSTTSIPNATATYVSKIFEANPNGGVAWTASGVVAADIVLNHVT